MNILRKSHPDANSFYFNPIRKFFQPGPVELLHTQEAQRNPAPFV